MTLDYFLILIQPLKDEIEDTTHRDTSGLSRAIEILAQHNLSDNDYLLYSGWTQERLDDFGDNIQQIADRFFEGFGID